MDEKLKEAHAAIDWSKLSGTNTISCRCEAVYRGKVKGISFDGRFLMISEHPCPNCSSHTDLRKISSDPEKYTIG